MILFSIELAVSETSMLVKDMNSLFIYSWLNIWTKLTVKSLCFFKNFTAWARIPRIKTDRQGLLQIEEKENDQTWQRQGKDRKKLQTHPNCLENLLGAT
jgi:hypothetical protein